MESRTIQLTSDAQKYGNLYLSRCCKDFFPEYAFEVELTTGFWSGVGRLSTLRDYSSTKLYVISNQPKKFTQVMSSFEEFKARFKHVAADDVGILYSAELRLRELRDRFVVAISVKS
jgi:hypothetical protein